MFPAEGGFASDIFPFFGFALPLDRVSGDRVFAFLGKKKKEEKKKGKGIAEGISFRRKDNADDWKKRKKKERGGEGEAKKRRNGIGKKRGR